MTTEPKSTEAAHPKVSPWTFALGEMGLGLVGNLVGTYALFFYTDKMGLPVALTALAATINAIWDGVDDPLFGYLSDRNRARRGRRFWLFFSFPLYVIATTLIWTPPANLEQNALFAYYLVFLLLFETAATISWVNYRSLFPSHFPEEHQRTNASAIRKALGAVAMIVSISLAPLIYGRFGFAAMGAVFSVSAAILLGLFLWRIRENRNATDAPAQETPNIFAAFAHAFRNRAFVIYALVYGFIIFAQLVLVSGIPFYTKYSLDMDEGATSMLLAAILVVGIPGVLLWTWLQRRIGSKASWLASSLMMAAGLVPFGLAANFTVVMIGGVVVGLGLAGFNVISEVIIADIIDGDAKKDGLRREGVFYSIPSILARLSGVFAAQSLALLTPLFGYVNGENPGSNPAAAFRFFMTVLPIAMLLLAAVLTWFYPQERKTVEGA
ncbi:MAG TPA: MFS transporter [Anaerolineae bacterium]|nr:MFS transporter [Anaerolineae bacterium]